MVDSHFAEWQMAVMQVTEEAALQLVSLCTAKGSKLQLSSKILHPSQTPYLQTSSLQIHHYIF